MNKKTPEKSSLHCPVCDSTEIYTIIGGYTGNTYKCKNCGYQGALVIEHSDDLKNEFEKASVYNDNIEGEASQKTLLNTILWIIIAALFILSIIAILIFN